jgi:PAS domain S-box-containing protein
LPLKVQGRTDRSNRYISPKPASTRSRAREFKSVELYWEDAPLGLATLDKNLQILKSNKAFRQFSKSILNPHFKEKLQPLIQKVFKTGNQFRDLELAGRRSVQSNRPDRWKISGYLLPAQARSPREILISVQDMTDTKRAEERLHQTIDYLPHGIVVADSDGCMTEVNIQTEKLFGYDRSELIGRSFDLLICEASRAAYQRYLEEYQYHPIARPISSARFLQGQHKDGRLVYLEVALNPIPSPDGVHIVISLMDVTDQLLAEQKLIESEKRFRRMADAAPVMIWQSGIEKECTYVNKRWLEFTGRPLSEQIGDGWLESIHPDDRTAFMNAYAAAFDIRQPLLMEYRLRRHDGEYRWVLDKGEPLHTNPEGFTGYIGSCVDITDVRLAQMELQKNQMELSHARRVSAVGELASSIAHELNQPLSAILSNAQAAQRFIQSDPTNLRDVQDILEDIVKDDKRAGSIIKRLRSLIKKKELEFETIVLNDVVAEVAELLQSDALQKRIRISLDLQNDLPLLRADTVQLQQILLNFLLNAFDAMADTPEELRCVSIQTRLLNTDQIRMSVKDGGHGIPVDQLDKIFQPFFTTKKDGLGMGLSIVRSIVLAHGGQISADNNPEGGATFHISLPILHD